MKQIIILLAGYPATGKTYLAKQIIAMAPDFRIISRDIIKEALFDQYGFENMEEKKQIEDLGWLLYYEQLVDNMRYGVRLLSDYPFSEKQKGRLQNLTEAYGYDVITIRMVGELKKLYERSRQRDLDPSRHLGHLVSKYHYGDTLEDRSKGDCFVSYDIFVDRCTNNGYDAFQLGHLIELDVTDFSKVDYAEVLAQIKLLL